MKITLTQDDGSAVDFLDPAGVQAAVDAAVAALPAGAPVAIEEVDVKETDGSTEVFDAQAPA